MWIKVEALLCCIIATSLAANEPRSKKKDDPRGKRNLDYSIAHPYSAASYRSERRISTGGQIPYYPLFYPVQKPYVPYRKGRPNYPAPPYAVQMEPLVHYSQRDPLYDANGLTFIGDGSNDLKSKEDLAKEHSHTSRSVYGHHEPVKHIIEKPVYIKEPEPIIEIIIKESNTTLPPLPIPTVTLPPRKKEQVQVFYVKYKKNPNAHGKDSIIYDKPIPALSPHIPDEPVQVEPPVIKFEAPITQSPPPSTTLRAIIKPDSEVYHADRGIHITFGKQENEQYKRSNDDAKEESAPEPAISRPQDGSFPAQPQGRQFNSSPERQFSSQSQFLQKQPPGPPNPSFQNFKPETSQRFPPFGTFNNQPQNQFKQQPQFGRQYAQAPQLQPHQHVVTTRSPLTFQSQQFPLRGASSSFQQLPGTQHVQFNQQSFSVRQPVAYQPFNQLRPQQNQSPQQSQIQFPRTHTHFPIHQQLPQVQHQQQFNPQASSDYRNLQATQQQFQNNLRHEELLRQQQLRQQQSQQFPQQQFPQQFVQRPQQSNFGQSQLNFGQQQHNFGQQQSFSQFSNNKPIQQERIIPPGGELIHSVPKFEQHISVPSGTAQPQALALQQSQSFAQPQIPYKLITPSNGQLTSQDFNRQIQQFNQPAVNQPTDPLSIVQKNLGVLNLHAPPTNVQQQYKQSSANQPSDPISAVQNKLAALNLQAVPASQISQQQFLGSSTAQTTSRPIIQVSSTTQLVPSSTAQVVQSSTQAPERLTEKDLKDLNIELPEEVPDDLKEQLLSSGILKNAQISVLDYDKVGDIPLSALPPDQLANFYGAGGAQQIAAAGSEQLSVVVDKDGKPVEENSEVDDMEMEGAESEVSEVRAQAPVEMKVVHYDPQTEQGQQVQQSYVQAGATQVDPVALNEQQQYNQYLPVKVNGAAFPIPNVPELKGRTISSVVILAPVENSPPVPALPAARKTRDVAANQNTRQAAEEALKVLLKSPTAENYRVWLEKENKTIPDKQAVVLLVTGDSKAPAAEKKIFMYDIATRTVSELSGELSSAFVDAAETNYQQQQSPTAAASDVVETRVPYPGGSIDRQDVLVVEETEKDLDDSASEYVEAKVPLIDPTQSDNLPEASEPLESFVDVSGIPVKPQEDLAVAASDAKAKQVSISSGYSKTGSNLFSH